MREDQFEPKIGRLRAPPSKRGRKYLHAVLTAIARAGGKGIARRALNGSRIARGSAVARALGSRDRHGGLRARRAIVKTRLVRLGGKGAAAARAHLRYIQRDGAARDGEGGKLYAAREDHVDGKAFLERSEGDRHQFRFIVSAEDAAEYDDLRPLVRRLMKRMEEDLGTSLDWVAADHLDTLHPHTHIILRGKDDRGENLVIAPEYISRGMRERVAELVSLDLGPRTDLEIERRLRLDVGAERLTATDRRLLREMNAGREVKLAGRDLFDHSVRAGRLRKLEALGLAEELAGGRWRLAPQFESSLRALGERGDIIRTMQRALSVGQARRAPADLRIFDPAASRALVGRVVQRGLADEIRDRHFLIVDGVDGRAHFVDIGEADAVGPLPDGAIVRIVPREVGSRDVDRTITAVAAANGGRYSVENHLRSDPGASTEFAQAHVRRLEAMRRALRLDRSADGEWRIEADHLDRIEALERRLARTRPVAVQLLSPLSVDRLHDYDGATWLDQELASRDAEPLRDAGFGREARAAIALRRAWLLQKGFAEEEEGRLVIRPGGITALQRRELLRVAGRIGAETGKDFLEVSVGTHVEGVVRRRIDLASGRFALVENARDFSLVPWKPVLERAVGKEISGVIGEKGISWTIRRDRSLGR